MNSDKQDKPVQVRLDAGHQTPKPLSEGDARMQLQRAMQHRLVPFQPNHVKPFRLARLPEDVYRQARKAYKKARRRFTPVRLDGPHVEIPVRSPES